MSTYLSHARFKQDLGVLPKELRKTILNRIENNNHKSFHFLKYLQKKARLPDDLRAIPDLLEYINIFEHKFKENQDLGFIFHKHAFTPYFKVLYPSITIKNSLGKTHTIKNLVVVFVLSWHENKWIIESFLGTRLTMTYMEVMRNYTHSHLNSDVRSSFFKLSLGNFCQGSSELGTLIAEFNIEENKDLKNLTLEALLYTLDTFVSWESLEGVPYEYIESLLPLGLEVTSPNTDYYNITCFVNALEKDKVPLDLEYYFHNGTIKIKDSLSNSEFIKEKIISDSLTLNWSIRNYFKDSFCYKDFSNKRKLFIKANSKPWSKRAYNEHAELWWEQNIIDLENPPFTYFCGQKHNFVLSAYTEKTTVINEDNIILHPNILTDVYRELENRIEKKRLRSAVFKKLTTLRNTQNSIRQNQVSL
jgi:hypothetical protein